MKLTTQSSAVAIEPNVVPLAFAPRGRSKPREQGFRFKVKEYQNDSGTLSYRVDGYKRDGTRVRENYADKVSATSRRLELETEWLQGEAQTEVQATKLTREQISLAEAAFIRLGPDKERELPNAIEYWLSSGRQSAVAESPRLDDAFEQFSRWLPSSELRELSQRNLKTRVRLFVNSVRNMRVADVTPERIDYYLKTREATAKTKDNDRRALSRFFAWCMGSEGAERRRQWTSANPCHKEKGKRKNTDTQPAVLTLAECRALLQAAEQFEDGRLVPYVAVSLFGGLRPFEAARLTWDAVNLTDGEIRLEGSQTKTGKARVVTICPTLRAWLQAYKDKPFFPSNWRKDFDEVKAAAGYGGRGADHPNLRPWPVDVMRHTAISHYFRQTGSYGHTAEQFGNSEAIIKAHYQGRVSSEDTKKFYGIKPLTKGTGK